MKLPGSFTGVVIADASLGRTGALGVHRRPSAPRLEGPIGLFREAGAAVIALVSRADQPELAVPPDVRLWYDRIDGIGPLASLHAALAECRTPWLGVLGIELQRIDATWFEWLAEKCDLAHGAVAQYASGLFEPLAAIYPRAALEHVTRHLASADHSLQGFVRDLIADDRVHAIPIPDHLLRLMERLPELEIAPRESLPTLVVPEASALRTPLVERPDEEQRAASPHGPL